MFKALNFLKSQNIVVLLVILIQIVMMIYF